MTPMQRRACLSLREITFGHFPTGARRFVRSMIDIAELHHWESIELSAQQLAGVARTLQRFRRQVNDANVLFWAQRMLVELATIPAGNPAIQREEPCPQ
jgi:hypothetical protein